MAVEQSVPVPTSIPMPKFDYGDIGRRVVYRTTDTDVHLLEGVLVGISEHLVFVRFPDFEHVVACLLCDVEFALPALFDNPENNLSGIDRPIFPHVFVQLTSEDLDVKGILTRVATAIAKGGGSAQQIKDFWEEATSGDFSNLIETCEQWVNVT